MNMLGIKVNPVTIREIKNILLEFATGNRIRTVFYLNAHCVNLACADEEYKAALNKADLVHADGQGVVWASGFLGEALPERVNVMDFFDEFAKELIGRKISIYLLGGAPGVVKRAGEILKNTGLNIVGYKDGFFKDTEEQEILKEINALQPDMLMIGMGSPKQEKWVIRHMGALDAKLCWAVGSTFELIAGARKRTPKWMSKHGLEWLYRLCQQPKRLCKRYAVGNLVFILRIFWDKVKKKN